METLNAIYNETDDFYMKVSVKNPSKVRNLFNDLNIDDFFIVDNNLFYSI